MSTHITSPLNRMSSKKSPAVDSPRKAYLKTLVDRPKIPRCPNGNIHCEDIFMGASCKENIGRYYYFVRKLSGYFKCVTLTLVLV